VAATRSRYSYAAAIADCKLSGSGFLTLKSLLAAAPPQSSRTVKI